MTEREEIELLKDGVFRLTYCITALRAAILAAQADPGLSTATKDKIKNECDATIEPVDKLIAILRSIGSIV